MCPVLGIVKIVRPVGALHLDRACALAERWPAVKKTPGCEQRTVTG